MSNNKKIKITDPERILTLANMISLLRAISCVPIVYTLRNPDWATYSFILILLAVLSDTADGWFARRAHEVTHFGKWLDPIADFVVIIAVTSYLVLEGRFPVWFYTLYLVRYLSIAFPSIYILNHKHLVLSANWWGKWATGISVLAIFLHIFPMHALPWMPAITLYIASFLLIVSWMQYYRRFIKELRLL